MLHPHPQTLTHSGRGADEEELLLADLDKVDSSCDGAKEGYVAYLKQYRDCLAEEQVDRLEGLWTQLDALWMRIKHWGPDRARH